MAYFPSHVGFQVPSLLGQSNHSFPDPFHPFESHHLEVLPGTQLQEIRASLAHTPPNTSSPADRLDMVPQQTRRRSRGRSAQPKGEMTKHPVGKKQKAISDGRKQKAGEKVVHQENPITTDYVHVRARRGQATDSHSLAERVRRKKISEKMRTLQALVPCCDQVNGKTVMLDRIIAYVQSLQSQVEYLSMKLASLSPIYDSEMRQDQTMEGPTNTRKLNCGQHWSPTMAATTASTMTETSCYDHHHHHLESSNLLQQVQSLFSEDGYCDGVLPWDMYDQTQKVMDDFDSSELGSALCSMYETAPADYIHST